MNRSKNLVFAALAVALVAGASACSRSHPVSAAGPGSTPPVAVRVVAASSSDVPLDVSAIGNVEALASVDVKSRVTAPVLRVGFADGQNIEKGQLLFELDPETYARQINELEANVAKDAAAEQEAKANIAKDKAAMTNTKSIADRAKALFKDGVMSKEQTDQAVANADSAQASIEADQAALESADATEKADRAKLAETKLQLSYCKIYAPISGRAGAIQTKAGNIASENTTTLVTLLQLSPIYVTFSVPQDILPEIRRYDAQHPLSVTAQAQGAPAENGTLKFIDNAVDMTTGTIKLKAAFGNAAHSLWPGEFVNVNATLEHEHNRILVPTRTVETGPQGKYVWVLNRDNTAAMRSVQVLRNYTPPGKPEQAVIGQGLQPGEMVVSEGQLRLAPGAHVRLLESTSAAS